MLRALEEIHDAYAQGEVTRAFLLLKNELRNSPSDGHAWEWLGMVQHRRGRYAIAVSALERAALLVPLRTASRVCLALGYGKIGRRQLSFDLLAGVLADDDLPNAMLLQVAAGFDAVDRPDQAVVACRKACADDPDFAQGYYELAYYAARCGRPTNVSESLIRRAIALESDNVCYRVGLATLLVRANRLADAHKLIAHWTVDDIPRVRCASCLNRMAEIFRWFDDDERAALCDRHARQIAGDYPPTGQR